MVVDDERALGLRMARAAGAQAERERLLGRIGDLEATLARLQAAYGELDAERERLAQQCDLMEDAYERMKRDRDDARRLLEIMMGGDADA